MRSIKGSRESQSFVLLQHHQNYEIENYVLFICTCNGNKKYVNRGGYVRICKIYTNLVVNPSVKVWNFLYDPWYVYSNTIYHTVTWCLGHWIMTSWSSLTAMLVICFICCHINGPQRPKLLLYSLKKFGVKFFSPPFSIFHFAKRISQNWGLKISKRFIKIVRILRPIRLKYIQQLHVI